jgi:ABC-2 type transporter
VAVLLALAMLIAMAFASLGAFAGLRARSGQAVQALFPLFFVLFFLSSVLLRRDLIEHDWFRLVATYNSVSYLVEGLRSHIVTGWGGDDLALGFGFAMALALAAGMRVVGGVTDLFGRFLLACSCRSRRCCSQRGLRCGRPRGPVRRCRSRCARALPRTRVRAARPAVGMDRDGRAGQPFTLIVEAGGDLVAGVDVEAGLTYGTALTTVAVMAAWAITGPRRGARRRVRRPPRCASRDRGESIQV